MLFFRKILEMTNQKNFATWLVIGAAGLYLLDQVRGKKRLADLSTPIFKNLRFGTEGILPVMFINMDIENPTDYSQKIDSIEGTVKTPQGNLTTTLRNPFTIGPKTKTPFTLKFTPTLSTIQTGIWLAKNYKQGINLDLLIGTPLGKFSSTVKLA